MAGTLFGLGLSVQYDAKTGHFKWTDRPSNRVKIGDRAGTVNTAGYRVITIKGKPFYEHRLAWFVHYGEWPAQEIDHINGDRSDNRIANLRCATHSQNSCNKLRKNKHGYMGVYRRSNGKYRSRIKIGNRIVNLGTFDTAKAAHLAYERAKPKAHGPFARMGG